MLEMCVLRELKTSLTCSGSALLLLWNKLFILLLFLSYLSSLYPSVHQKDDPPPPNPWDPGRAQGFSLLTEVFPATLACSWVGVRVRVKCPETILTVTKTISIKFHGISSVPVRVLNKSYFLMRSSCEVWD